METHLRETVNRQRYHYGGSHKQTELMKQSPHGGAPRHRQWTYHTHACEKSNRSRCQRAERALGPLVVNSGFVNLRDVAYQFGTAYHMFHIGGANESLYHGLHSDSSACTSPSSTSTPPGSLDITWRGIGKASLTL